MSVYHMAFTIARVKFVNHAVKPAEIFSGIVGNLTKKTKKKLRTGRSLIG